MVPVSAGLPGECAAGLSASRGSAALDIPGARLSLRNVIVKLPETGSISPDTFHCSDQRFADVGLTLSLCHSGSFWEQERAATFLLPVSSHSCNHLL